MAPSKTLTRLGNDWQPIPENPYQSPEAESERLLKPAPTSDVRWLAIVAKAFGVVVAVALLSVFIDWLLVYRALYLRR